MKPSIYSQYESPHASLAERALLTVWPSLDEWFDDLVLVGGLVPQYICGDVNSPRDLPRMHFGSEDALAPKKAAEFFPGPSSAREPPGVREQRLQIQQEMVS